MTPSRWARVWQAEAHGLRRGAWYLVVNESASNMVVLDVNKANRPVHRSSLQFSDVKPNKWSVVERVPSEGAALRASDADLGPVYGVCPDCRARATLDTADVRATCTGCHSEFEVDWANPC